MKLDSMVVTSLAAVCFSSGIGLGLVEVQSRMLGRGKRAKSLYKRMIVIIEITEFKLAKESSEGIKGLMGQRL